MARATKRLVDQELWPQFQKLHETLHAHLSDVTKRVIAEAVHGDVSEPEVRRKPRELPAGATVDFE
jgi:hypothetical protein